MPRRAVKIFVKPVRGRSRHTRPLSVNYPAQRRSGGEISKLHLKRHDAAISYLPDAEANWRERVEIFFESAGEPDV